MQLTVFLAKFVVDILAMLMCPVLLILSTDQLEAGACTQARKKKKLHKHHSGGDYNVIIHDNTSLYWQLSNSDERSVRREPSNLARIH